MSDIQTSSLGTAPLAGKLNVAYGGATSGSLSGPSAFTGMFGKASGVLTNEAKHVLQIFSGGSVGQNFGRMRHIAIKRLTSGYYGFLPGKTKERKIAPGYGDGTVLSLLSRIQHPKKISI